MIIRRILDALTHNLYKCLVVKKNRYRTLPFLVHTFPVLILCRLKLFKRIFLDKIRYISSKKKIKTRLPTTDIKYTNSLKKIHEVKHLKKYCHSKYYITFTTIGLLRKLICVSLTVV